MEFDEKAISFLKRAKEEGIAKEEAFATLRTKGYDVPESQTPERLPEPPADMENYINQKSEEMPYNPNDPIAFAEQQKQVAQGLIDEIDKANAEYGPLAEDVEPSSMMVSGGIEKNVKPEFGSPLLLKAINALTLGRKNPTQEIVNTLTSPDVTIPMAEASRQGAYLALPAANLLRGFKGAQLANALLSGTYQGGLVGAAENALEGKNALEGAKEGALWGGGIAGGFSAIPMVGKITGKPISKAYSFVNELLSGVPREYTERALQKEMAGQSIFKGKFDPLTKVDELGMRAQDAINDLKSQAGKATGKERQALKLINENINTQPISNRIDELLAENTSRSGISRLDKSDLSAIQEVKDLLLQNNYADDLDSVLVRIQDKIKPDINRVKTTTGTGDYVLGQIADVINDTFPQNFKDAKSGYKQVKDLQKKLSIKLKDTNINRTLQNIDSEANINAGYYDLFGELDAMAPQNLKFMDEAEDLIARRAFENLLPGRGGGSGSAQGAGNLFRNSALTSLGTASLFNPNFLLAAPLAATFSPKIHKLGIQGAGALNKLLENPQGQEYTRKALIQSLLTSPASP